MAIVFINFVNSLDHLNLLFFTIVSISAQSLHFFLHLLFAGAEPGGAVVLLLILLSAISCWWQCQHNPPCFGIFRIKPGAGGMLDDRKLELLQPCLQPTPRDQKKKKNPTPVFFLLCDIVWQQELICKVSGCLSLAGEETSDNQWGYKGRGRRRLLFSPSLWHLITSVHKHNFRGKQVAGWGPSNVSWFVSAANAHLQES